MLGSVDLYIIGMHNILNSLVAIGVAMALGVDFSFIKDVIRDFKGPDRRFIVTHLDSDILVIDDYAHHPTEIRATLKALEDSDKRIVAVVTYGVTEHRPVVGNRIHEGDKRIGR